MLISSFTTSLPAAIHPVLLAIHDLCGPHAPSHIRCVCLSIPHLRGCPELTVPTLARSVCTDYSLFYYFLLWIALVVVSTAFIFIHGIDYVSWPRLQPPTDIIYYDGPGFRSAHHGKGLGLPVLEKAGSDGVGEKEHRRARSKKLDEIEMGSIPAKEHFD